MKQASHDKTSTVGFHLHEIPRAGNPHRLELEWWFPGAGGREAHAFTHALGKQEFGYMRPTLPAVRVGNPCRRTITTSLSFLAFFSPQVRVCRGHKNNLLWGAGVLCRDQEILYGSLPVERTLGVCSGGRREKTEAQKQGDIQWREVAHGKIMATR